MMEGSNTVWEISGFKKKTEKNIGMEVDHKLQMSQLQCDMAGLQRKQL